MLFQIFFQFGYNDGIHCLLSFLLVVEHVRILNERNVYFIKHCVKQSKAKRHGVVVSKSLCKLLQLASHLASQYDEARQ